LPRRPELELRPEPRHVVLARRELQRQALELRRPSGELRAQAIALGRRGVEIERRRRVLHAPLGRSDATAHRLDHAGELA
jgi:hypothetical protein